MALLIDTSALVTVERRGMPLIDGLDLIAGSDVMVSTITISELLIGAYRATRPFIRAQRELFIQGLVDRLSILPVDLDVARVHARLGARLTAGGVSIGAHDLLIGATAVTHGAIVVTENLRDFERIPGLQVFRPEW